MAEQPSAVPHWADDPPAAPPSTVTEPSEPEKDEGFQPGVQAQVTDFLIDNVINAHTYNTRINGVSADYLSDGSATAAEIRGGLVSAINGLSEPVTATDTGTSVRVTADVAGVAFVADTTDGANVHTTLITANKSNKPIRQFLNWLFNILCLWVAWLDQVTWLSSDMHPDHPLPSGDTPGTGAGLGPIAADDFSARVYVNGYGVGPIGSPAHTYGATTDTYWDLGVDGQWTAVEVAALASEPALTADSIRVYRVRTDATDRTAIVDRRRERVNVSDFDEVGNVRFTTPRMAQGLSTNEAERIAPRRTDVLNELSGQRYAVMHDIVGKGGIIGPSQYLISSGLGDSAGRVLVTGATLTGDDEWTPSQDNVHRFDWEPNDDVIGLRYRRITGLTPGAPFADSLWDDQLAAGTTRLQLPIAFGLKVGGDLMGQEDDADANLVPILAELVRNAGGALRTEYIADKTAGQPGLAEYISVEDAITQYERVINARWNDATEQWARTVAGASYMMVEGIQGFAVYRRDSGDASPWDTADWLLLFRVNGSNTLANGDMQVGDDLAIVDDATIGGDLAVTGAASVGGDLTVTGATSVGGALTAGSYPDIEIAKVVGTIVTDGAAGYTSGASGLNYTATFNGNSIRISMTTPFASTDYHIPAPGVHTGGPTAQGARVTIISASVFDIEVRNYSDTILNAQAVANIKVSFLAFGLQ